MRTLSIFIVLALVAAFLGFMLMGCAVVEVRAEGGKPHLSAWLGGVRVSRGTADAVSVNATILAPAICSAGPVGVAGGIAQRCQAIAIDGSSCGVGIVERPSKHERGVLAAVSDQSRAICARQSPKVNP
jgi:hypothetical protein